jgi:predicted nucleotidyltransferase
MCNYQVMEGYTIAELANMLGLPHKTVMSRIRAAGIIPRYKAGRVGLYGEETVEKIKSAPSRGRPMKNRGAT